MSSRQIFVGRGDYSPVLPAKVQAARYRAILAAVSEYSNSEAAAAAKSHFASAKNRKYLVRKRLNDYILNMAGGRLRSRDFEPWGIRKS